MSRVRSADGTLIAYETAGSGPPVVLVGGGLDDGTENVPLAAELAGRCAVLNYARRGRAESGDTPPYAVEREIEDLAALLDRTGAPAHLFGASSGGALVLAAAAAGLPIASLAVYEVPYCVDDADARAWKSYVDELGPLLAAGRSGDALASFMRLAGSSDADIAGARSAPVWPVLERLAPTLAHDAACVGRTGRPPVETLAAITQPALVLTGEAGADPHTAGLGPDFFTGAADAVAAALPAARRHTLARQGHVADPAVLSTILADFYTAH